MESARYSLSTHTGSVDEKVTIVQNCHLKLKYTGSRTNLRAQLGTMIVQTNRDILLEQQVRLFRNFMDADVSDVIINESICINCANITDECH
ncbi:hypothetical protein NPIL_364531 [Nephila pilipes]|uniref:Uncharacterized protein n=1 Tax=Nephila pilipes TaxID=299642 RepID=A0A8X6TTQ9_NEPPI|nr:hypothetical protein NPIL_364531 [Nephila pilipes]